MADLGPRVEADVKIEEEMERKKKAEIKKRIEERRKAEGEDEISIEDVQNGKPGFVPMSELKNKWRQEEEDALDSEKKPSVALAFTLPPIMLPVAPKQSKDSTASFPENEDSSSKPETEEKKSEHVVPLPPLPAANNNKAAKEVNYVHFEEDLIEEVVPEITFDREARFEYEMNKKNLDLQPISKPKKRRGGLMKRLNRTTPLNGSLESKQSSSGSEKSLRDNQVIRAYM